MGKKTFIPPMGPKGPGKIKPKNVPAVKPQIRRPGKRGG
jgi:hypothetical protein